MLPAPQIRSFDFVVDNTGEFRTKPHPSRSTIAHSGTILFDPESEAVVYDMSSVEDQHLRSYFLSDTRVITSGFNSRCVAGQGRGLKEFRCGGSGGSGGSGMRMGGSSTAWHIALATRGRRPVRAVADTS